MEDVYFTMGVSGDGLVASLEQAESGVKKSLAAIAQDFDNFKKTISSSSGNPLAGFVGSLQPIADLMRQLRDDIRNMKSSTITLNTSQAQANIRALQSRVASLSSQTNSMGRSGAGGTGGGVRVPAFPTSNLGSVVTQGQTLNQVFQKSAGLLRNVSTVLSTIGLGGGIFSLIYGFKQLISQGVEFDAQVEQAKLSLGAIVAATAEKVELDGKQLKGMAAIEGVQGNIGEIVEKLKSDAIFTNGTFSDLLKIATAITGPVLRMGGSLADVERLTRSIGIAASILGVSFDEATTGVLQLLNNTINKRNDLIRKLPVGTMDELRKGLSDAGNRANFLLSIFSKFDSAAPLIMRTWTGVTHSMQDVIQQMSGRALEPAKERIQSFLNDFVTRNVSQNPEGGVQFSEALEQKADQARRIVEELTVQVTDLAKQLFNDGGSKTFLDVLESNLPKVVQGLFTLAELIKSVTVFLVDHANTVLTVIAYYAGFRVVTGIIGSVAVALNNVGKALLFVADMSAGQASLGAFTANIERLVTGGIIAGLSLLVVDMGSRMFEAKHEADAFYASLDQLNKLNFDPLIEGIRKLREELKNPSMGNWISEQVAKFNGNVTFNEATAQREAVKMRTAQSALGGLAAEQDLFHQYPQSLVEKYDPSVWSDPVKRAKIHPEVPTVEEIGGFATQSQKNITAINTKAATLANDDPYRNVLAAQKTKAEQLHEASIQFLTQYRELYNLTHGAGLGLPPEFMLQGSRAGTVLSQIGLPEHAVITPGKKPGEDDATKKRQDEYREVVIKAVKDAADARMRVIDAAASTEKALIKGQDSDSVGNTKDTADKELAIIQKASQQKVSVMKKEFEDLAPFIGTTTFRALGLTDGNGKPSFDKLKSLPQGSIEESLVKTGLRDVNTKDPLLIERNTKLMKDSQQLIDMQKRLAVEHETVAKADADHSKTLNEADKKSEDFQEKFNDMSDERIAKAKQEALQLSGTNARIESRISFEKQLAAAQLDSQTSEITKRWDKERRGINGAPYLDDADKSADLAKAGASEQMEKDNAAAQNQLTLVKSIADIRQSDLQIRQTLNQADEVALDTLRSQLGSNNMLVLQRENLLKVEKERTFQLQAQAELSTADSYEQLGMLDVAEQRRAAAEQFTVQAKQMQDAQQSYVQTVGTSLDHFASIFGGMNKNLGSGTGSLGKLLGAIGNLNKADLGQLYDQANQNAGGGILGAISGTMASGDPVAEAAGAAVGMFQSFFDMFSVQAQMVLQQVQNNLQQAIGTILNSMKQGQGYSQAISQLQAEIPIIQQQLDAQKISGFLSFFTGTNTKIDETIQSDILNVENQILQLKQAAEDAAYALHYTLIPTLSVTPAMQQFEAQLQSISQQLKDYENNPDVTESDVAAWFAGESSNLQNQAQTQILTNQQDYVNVLKQEKSIKLQIAQIDEQQLEAAIQYKNQRSELLGISVTQLSKAQQLQMLDTNYNLQTQGATQQKQDLEDQLNSVTQQVSVYQQIFGVVQDIGAYQDLINTSQAHQLSNNLTALMTFYQQLQAYISAAGAYIPTQTPGSPTYYTGIAPGYLPPGTPTTPVPISIPGVGGAPTPSPNIGTQTNVTIGSITISGSNLSPADVTNAVRLGMRDVDRSVSSKGLAFTKR